MPSTVSLKSLVLCSIAGAATLLAGGCDKQSGGDTQPQASQAAPESSPAVARKLDRSHKGMPIPDLTLADPTGESLDLTSLK
ncbi:MAG: TlpA family protein disulfide reductase, partial [Novosphingobium sp.]